jgi:hypothetical protein
MLRSANRLDQYLASKGHGVAARGTDEDVKIIVREAELVEPLSVQSGQLCGASSLAVPLEFCFPTLNWLLFRLDTDESHISFYLCEGRQDRDSSNLSAEVALSDWATFDVLWLSTAVFLTQVPFRGGLWVETMYTMNVEMNEVHFRVHAHRLLDCFPWDAGSSELPLRFMAHQLAQIYDLVTASRLELETTAPEEAVLALVPSVECTLSKTITVTLGNPTRNLLGALASHQIHSKVLLRLDWGLTPGIPKSELNDILLGFHCSIHLQVPGALLDFKDCETSFAANPAFTSLTITASASRRLSHKLLHAMAHSTSMKHLTIDCYDWIYQAECHLVGDLFRSVVLENSCLQSLTLMASYDRFTSLCSFKDLQRALIPHLDKSQMHGLSRFRVALLNHLRKPFRVTEEWDSQFSPALALNCLCRRQGGCPSAGISGFAIQSINKGALYRLATNLVPWDRSASSATVILYILRCHMSAKHCKRN